MDFKNLNDGQKSGLGFSLFITSYLIITFIVRIFTVAIFKANPLTARVVNSLALPIAAILLAFVFKNTEKRALLSVCKVSKFSPAYLVVAVAISVGMFCGLGFLNDVIAKWLKLKSATLPLDGAASLVLLVFAVGVLPAIFEEIVFRGIILDKLNGVKPLYAILLVGLAFSIYHGSLNQLAYQFIYGAALAYLTVRAGSIIPAVLSHFINNFAVLMLTYFKVNVDLYNGFVIAGGLLALACAAAFLVFFRRSEKSEYADGKAHTLGFIAFASVGALACVALIVVGVLV